MSERPSGGWEEYQRLVLSELERLSKQNQEQGNEIDDLRTKLWAAIGGAVAVFIAIGIALVNKL